MRNGANYVPIHTVSSAGVLSASPVITLDKTFSTAFKGAIHLGATITFNNAKHDPIMAEFIKAYLSATSTTSDEYFEDGKKNGTGEIPQLVALFHGGTDSDGTDTRRQLAALPVILTTNSGDFTNEYNKTVTRSLELQAVEWNGSADITIAAAKWSATLVDITDTTNATYEMRKLPATIEVGTFGTEGWAKLPA